MAKSIMNEETELLFEAILKLEDKKECLALFQDLCTVNEIQAMSQRIHVAKLLREDAKYQDIVEKTGASTATISRISRALNYGADGYELVLKRMSE